ncbi:MAG TPA: carboxymuconolactone decarboxylase family protein [Bacteroidota bacterium]
MLTTRERFGVTFAALFAAGLRNRASAMMRKGITETGLPETMFAELCLHLSLLLGFPAMLDGLARLREITPRKDAIEPLRDRNRDSHKRGMQTLRTIYGTALPRLMTNLESLHAIVPDIILRDVYGKIISRPGLSLRERELVNVAVLSIQGLDDQLFSHLRGALRVGVPAGALREVIRGSAKLARTDSRQPLKMLSTLTNSKEKTR